jgi:hypothetical protein
MAKITYYQYNILAKQQLYLILKNIVDQSYQQMNNNSELIQIFKKKYDINKNIESMDKCELIDILLKFNA